MIQILYTDDEGIARLRELKINCERINERVSLSGIFPATGLQFRRSPESVYNDWHCTSRDSTQWVVVTRGVMRIGLRDGSEVDFHPGDMFLAMDIQPGDEFKSHHGHTSRAIGSEPLETLFVKVPFPEAEKLLNRSLLSPEV